MEWLETHGGSFYSKELKFDENISKLGAYVCFCDYQAHNLEMDSDRPYTLEYKDENGDMQTMEENICHEYGHNGGIFVSYGYYIAIFLVVQIVFLILYYCSLPMMSYNTKTTETI